MPKNTLTPNELGILRSRIRALLPGSPETWRNLAQSSVVSLPFLRQQVRWVIANDKETATPSARMLKPSIDLANREDRLKYLATIIREVDPDKAAGAIKVLDDLMTSGQQQIGPPAPSTPEEYETRLGNVLESCPREIGLTICRRYLEAHERQLPTNPR